MTMRASTTALIALLSTALSACGVGEAKVTETVMAAPLPVEISQPERADIYATYHTTGTLSSDSDAPIMARVGGEVVEIFVEEGDIVERGQVLAKLDGERLRFEMKQAEAEYKRVTSEYERLIDLHERGLVSAAMYDGLQFDMHALKAAYELKRLNYQYTFIRAPISGVISSRDIKLGRQLTANDPTFRITDTDRLVAYLKVPQTELSKFESGLAMKLSVDAMPEIMYAAIVERISPTIDVTNGTFRATAYIDNSNHELAPGMFARFQVAYEKHEDALVVPSEAVIQEDNLAFVYVVTNGEAERRAVRTGIQSDDVVEILDGLSSDDLVVTTGLSGLKDGSQVLASNIPADRVSG